MRRVAEQCQVVVDEGLVANRAEGDPLAVVGEQRSTVKIVLEYLCDALNAFVITHSRRKRRGVDLVEAGLAPGVFVHLDDERAALRVHRIRVNLHGTPRGVAHEELEGVVHSVGAEPHELALARINRGTEVIGVLVTNR